MAKAKSKYPYVTHVGLILDVQPEGEEWVVTITGDRVKELGKTKDTAAALAIADPIYEHYEQRRKDEVTT